MINGITLTGADDTVTPEQLIKMSDDFPFVEWGLLIGSIAGPRFPSCEWFDSLRSRATLSSTMKLSLHICGSCLRQMIQQGSCDFAARTGMRFGRAQLNFHGDPIETDHCDNIIKAIKSDLWMASETIVQLDGVNDWVLDELLNAGIIASGLYDTSHGAGVKPIEWPSPHQKWKVGYAGGLGPNTLLDDMKNIECAVGQKGIWIDMETKLRSNIPSFDFFDLDKCRAVLMTFAIHFTGRRVL